MAFGFGFNKQKVLSAAEKFVQQGKLQNAISEYEKVLKADPKDLTVMNTVGDLYSRMGDSQKAVECFKSVGDAYAAQGFTVKAIAMYKKLSKSKASLESALRLAELYTQQGLFNDARAQYLQVAEEFLRAGQLEQAVRIFQKTLEMDPENVAMRTRLADTYVRLGKKSEALQIFAAAAETLRKKGQFDAALGILQRMTTLDPGNREVLLLRGQTALDSLDYPAAIEDLEKVSDLEANREGLAGLFRAYLEAGRWPDAGLLAEKLLTLHNEIDAVQTYATALLSAGKFDEALALYSRHADRLLASDPARVLESLHSIIGHMQHNPAALEVILDLLKKADESTHLTELYELLGHAYVQSGDLAKARDYYLKLTQLEPQNQLHANNYQQVLAKIGSPSASRLITPEEGAALVEELETLAPCLDQRYEDKTALALRAALTDAELFISYNMPVKALGPLLSVLPTAPRDLRLNQRLLSLYTRSGNFAEAAVYCRTLESVYHEAGHPEEAARYADIAGRYEERATAPSAIPEAVLENVPSGKGFAEPAAASPALESEPGSEIQVTAPEEVRAPWPTDSGANVAPAVPGLFFHSPIASPPAPPHSVAEERIPTSQPASESDIDLYSEWEGTVSDEDLKPAPIASTERATYDAKNAQVIQETVDEIRFYLSQAMGEEAHAALETLRELAPPASLLAAVEAEVAGARQRGAQPLDEVSVEDSIIAAEPPAPEPRFEAPGSTRSPAGEHFASLPSLSGRDALISEPVSASIANPRTAEAPKVAARLAKPVEPESASPLADLATALDESLGESFAPGSPTLRTAVPVAPTHVSNSAISAAPDLTGAAGSVVQPQAAMAAAAPHSASSFPLPLAPAAHTVPLDSPAALSASEQTAGIDLSDMFGELKTELEQDATLEEGDPETHYNLGVAFREMGLLDEAIGELQKVCQAVDSGHAFGQVMQTYTWLAQCFLDKGIPEAAIRWYEQALKLPQIDQQTRMALHYELAGAYETAGDKVSALSNFMQVYGSNIDYRDVGERIRALKS